MRLQVLGFIYLSPLLSSPAATQPTTGFCSFGLETMYTSMDLSLKPCTTTTTTTAAIIDVRNRSDSLLVDRLTGLPDDLLIRILSLLPTKYAAATCVLSRRLSRILPWITSLDLDDPVSHCPRLPTRYESFHTFVRFLDTILQAHQSQYLSRFRLAVGPSLYPWQLKPTQINGWISFPLTRRGLRELDLRVRMREPGDFQLPPAIFTCETLEVLKLDANIGIDHVSVMPSFRLPILKLLHLRVSPMFEDPGFVTRLVSSCPLLEDFTGEATTMNHVRSINISSPSLRRLRISIYIFGVDNTDFVSIHTPNLEYLDYDGNSALQYSITNMDCLGKADISIRDYLLDEGPEVSCQRMLSFIRPLSKVHCLSLDETCMQILNRVEVKDQLPVFCNLKHLELGCTGNNYWYKVLLAFFNCSPILETFVFPQGMVADKIEMEEVELEREFCRTALAIIPWCCRFHLKRVVIKNCFGKQREIDLIHFLLRHALVLEELVISRSMVSYYPIADMKALHSTLQNLPRASSTCTIQVQ